MILEAAASYTSGRGFDGKTGWNLTELFANNGSAAIEVIDRTEVYGYEPVSIVGEVDENGQLTYGMRNVADGGNWFVVQLNSVKVTDKPVTTSGLNSVVGFMANAPAGKRLVGGRLVITRNGRTYNAIGQETTLP